MLELNQIRKNPDFFIARLSVKNYDAKVVVTEILEQDKTVRDLKNQTEALAAESNRIAKEIPKLISAGEKDKQEEFKTRATEIKNEVKKIQSLLEDSGKKLQLNLIKLPNLPHESVPNGTKPEDNKIVNQNNIKTEFPEAELPHWDLVNKYKLIDFETGNKITGPGFPVYTNMGARLLRAIINFCIDSAVSDGYTEMYPPLFVNEDSVYGTGQLPDKDSMMYFIPQDNLYAIPTAEVPLTNIYRDTVLKEADLPIRVTGYTPCFRREAGSWGSHVRGLNRLHQFDKVEIVEIHKPEHSYMALERMRTYVENLVMKLNLPSRTLLLCGGDMSFTSSKTYDIEVYSAGQKKWLEVSSVSNFVTFQSNRMKIRYKDQNKNSVLVHTLNGSALGLARILAAIIENNQQKDRIIVPEVLRKYTGFEEVKISV